MLSAGLILYFIKLRKKICLNEEKIMDFYGTIGPACANHEILARMYENGMTGIRLNLSHGMLEEHADWLKMASEAAESVGKNTKILIDLQGPELRVGVLKSECVLTDGSEAILGDETVPIPKILFEYCKSGMHLLLDDGKIEGEIITCDTDKMVVKILRGGILRSRKSIAVCDVQIPSPTLTEQDMMNLKVAKKYGVTGVMLPFVRHAEDLIELKKALKDNDSEHIQVFAKIENMQGVEALESFMALADEIIIARGDLGNAMPLWELPRVQKSVANICRKSNKPFMVVTQMLDSMEHRQVPTRAEVSDIYNAVLDGASSVMLTGETAIGDYPAEAILYLVNTAQEALKYKTEDI